MVVVLAVGGVVGADMLEPMMRVVASLVGYSLLYSMPPPAGFV
jgi:hypothetical protein